MKTIEKILVMIPLIGFFPSIYFIWVGKMTQTKGENRTLYWLTSFTHAVGLVVLLFLLKLG